MAKDRTLFEQLNKNIFSFGSSPEEDFQNKVLRPIIKMQSDLLMAHIRAQIVLLKYDWDAFDTAKRKEIVTALMTNDQLFKRELIGMIVGQFEPDEHETYLGMRNELNRRITQIVLQRALDIFRLI